MEYTGLALICLFVTAIYGAPHLKLIDFENSSTTREDVNYRLPNHTVPINYNIKIIPFIIENNFTYDGQIDILVSVKEITNSITLHKADEIKVQRVTVTTNDTKVPLSDTSYDANLQFFTINFIENLDIGIYRINIEFSGILNDEMSGFYRSYYITDAGEKRWLATTQFEPVSARRAFPCFDEPGMKATFDISVAHFLNMTAVSNMPEIDVTPPNPLIGNRVWTTFDTTPIMSTYLVAFIVSDFEYISNLNETIRVWSRPNAIHATQYSLAIAERGLKILSEFTNFNYFNSLPKIDFFAIPDFSAGAMENWGVTTYREQNLLWKDGESTTGNKQSIAMVIVHELAHQWFGNLVGPAWWSNIWLNEGFATYFEKYATSLINPDWGIMDHQFTTSVYHAVFIDDSLENTHPIIHYVEKQNAIRSSLDSIAYSKGGSVLRMISHILREDNFRDGIRLYIKSKAYSNATADDLWEAFEKVSSWSVTNLPITVHIKTVTDTWTKQKGYPLITVNRNYVEKTQNITQERFLLNGRGSSNDTTRYSWWVPLNFATKSSHNFLRTQPTDWIPKDSDSIVRDGFNDTEWIICNNQQTGYYRVNYDEINWKLLTDYLQSSDFKNIHVTNRAQLIDDSLNLARSGYLKYEIALSLTRYLTQEDEYAPWTAFFRAINHLKIMLSHSDAYDNFETYIQHLVNPLHNKLTHSVIDEEHHLTRFNRLNALSWSCSTGNAHCTSEAEKLLLEYYVSNDPENHPLVPDLKAWFYCEGIRHANASVWKFLLDRYYKASLDNEKILILTSLGCNQDKDNLFEYMLLPLKNDSGIRDQDKRYVFSSVYTKSHNNVDITFDFLVKNYQTISTSSGGVSTINQILSGVATRMVSEEQLNKLKEFVSDKSDVLGASLASANQAIRTVENNINWLKKYEGDISAWLKNEVLSYRSSATSFTISTVLVVLTVTVFKIL